MKEYIKALVKESLGGLLREKSKTPEKEDKKDSDNNKENKEESNVEQISRIKTYFKKNKHLINQVGIFKLAGFSKEDIYQRLPYTKLRDGTLNQDEITRILTAIDSACD